MKVFSLLACRFFLLTLSETTHTLLQVNVVAVDPSRGLKAASPFILRKLTIVTMLSVSYRSFMRNKTPFLPAVWSHLENLHSLNKEPVDDNDDDH